MSTAIVTSVTRNYIPLARVLMDSVARHFPDSQRYVLLLDGETEPISGAHVLRMSDILSPQEEVIQQFIYRPYQLATALKPKLLKHVLDLADNAIFLDPDMRLYGSMAVTVELLRSGSGTLLTPHRISPPSQDNRDLYEWAFKMYGTYNTGMVGVTNASLPFLEWWDSRLQRDCLGDPTAGHWLDQKVVDLAPAYFEMDLLKDPGYNVGWWNLEERTLRKEEGTWYVGSTPLVLMHFSSVRPNREAGDLPYLVYSPHSHVAEDPAAIALVRELEDSYIADLYAAGFSELGSSPYAYDTTPEGRPFSPARRERYRRLVIAAEAAGAVPPRPDDLYDLPLTTKLKQAATDLARTYEVPKAMVHDGRRLWRTSREVVAGRIRRE